MPDLGKEYHPMRIRQMGWAILILFSAGLALCFFIAMVFNLFALIFLSITIVPIILLALSSLTVIEWELDPARKDQRSVEAKQARHLLRMQKARTGIYALCLIFFAGALVPWMLVMFWGWTSACRMMLVALLVTVVAAMALPLSAARTVYAADMEEHRVYIENGLARQKGTPRFGHYRITPFRADQVKRAVWSTNPKGENMYVHFQMVRPEEQVVYPIHQDTILDEAAFKAFLQGRLEEKDVPSPGYVFPSDR